MEVETKSAQDLRREIQALEQQLDSKQKTLVGLMRGTKNADGGRNILPHQAEEIRMLEGQCVTLTDKIQALKLDFIQVRTEEDLERRGTEPLDGPAIFQRNGGTGVAPGGVDAAKGGDFNTHTYTTLGDAFIAGKSYKSFNHGSQGQLAHVEAPGLGVRYYASQAIKAPLTTATGPFTSIEKQPDVITLGQQELTLADLFSQAQTNNTTIRYIQEDTYTNAAAPTAEDALKPEQVWDLSEVDSLVKKIAVWTKVTSEMFEDYAQIRDYINQRLPFGIRQREELQLLNGDGTGANLLGVLNVPGVLTQAKGTFSNIDAIYLGITKVRTQGFWEPDAVVIDPTNWSPIRLLKTTTGEYVYGHPALPGPETVFGKRVVVTANMVDNVALVGAFRIGGTIFYRHGVRVEATNSDQDDFIRNRLTLRGEIREALAVWRPPAFCKVTGLDVAP